MEHNHPPTMRDRILEKISADEVTMRPRLFFVLKVAAIVFVAFTALVLSIFICSYILFSIRVSSSMALMRFGPPGWLVFLQLFPWALLVVDTALLVLLEWMLRHFRFGYRSPVLYLLAALFVLIISASIVVDQSRLSDRMLERARHRHVPVFEGLYERGHRPPPPHLR